jgi:hypothetical protein
LFAIIQLSGCFNSDFYDVAATVIPIFFVALLLPNSFLYEYWRRVEIWHNRNVSHVSGRATAQQFPMHLVYVVGVLPPMVVVVAGGVAETCAILALNNHHASFFEHAVVLIYFLLLPLVSAGGVMVMVIAGSSGDDV